MKSVNSKTMTAIHTSKIEEVKLTQARWIAAIKEEMSDDEHAAYLNSRDMEVDFCGVEL